VQEYDIALKRVLSRATRFMKAALDGVEVVRWLNVELPQVTNSRVDLLGEAADRTLVHIEIQSTNDASMALRMGEYCLGIYRQLGRIPRQVVLYFGEKPLRMRSELIGHGWSYRYTLVDVRKLDGQPLLEAADVGDNISAVLTRLRDSRAAVRLVLLKIADLPPADREPALTELLILAGLRSLSEFVELEASKMPILNDIMDHPVLGREFKRGLKEGRAEGRAEGERAILRRQIEKRFGATPDWVEERLASRSAAELEDLSVRLLDASSLDELLS
jgi:hypothetical protein